MVKGLIISVILFVTFHVTAFPQKSDDTINAKEVSRILNKLASDDMKGRGDGMPELLSAGLFIEDEYLKSGLRPFADNHSFFVPFRPFGGPTKIIPDCLKWNSDFLAPEQFLYLHARPGNYEMKKLSDFTIVHLKSSIGDDVIQPYFSSSGNVLIWTTHKSMGKRNFLPVNLKTPADGLKSNLLLVCADSAPDSILLSGITNYYDNLEYNLVGMLPGKSKPGEIIIFSAHYDHVGIYPGGKDTIMNGANDDASGVTALLALANYFSKRNDNARTIVFCAFAGEELGLLGSGEFAAHINPEQIVAVINIEMIGVPEFGKNKVFISGAERSELPAILKKGLTTAHMQVIGEPDKKRKIFERSDNFSFVKYGIPAHSIMSSDDKDACYHKPCDEIRRIDIPTMTAIIKAIGAAALPLINGEDTPSRVKGNGLK